MLTGPPPKFHGTRDNLVNAAVALTVLMSGLRGPRDDTVLAMSAIALLSAYVAGAYVVKRTPIPFGIKGSGVLVASLSALALPVLQLWQSTSFAAYTEQVSISLTPTVKVVNANDREFRVLVSLTAKNTSTFRAFMLASELRICWGHLDEDLGEVLSAHDPAVCQSWQPIGRRNWIDATSELTVSKTFVIPRDMDQVIVGARADYARGDRVRLVADSETEEADHAGCKGATLLCFVKQLWPCFQ
jgi:hypothetical protein